MNTVVIKPFLCYTFCGDNMTTDKLPQEIIPLLLKVGSTLRALRWKKQITLKELSNKCKIAESQIGKYERGQVNFTFVTLNILLKGLGVSFDTFINYLAANNENDFYKVEASNKYENYVKIFNEADIDVYFNQQFFTLKYGNIEHKLLEQDFIKFAATLVNQLNIVYNEECKNMILAEFFRHIKNNSE